MGPAVPIGAAGENFLKITYFLQIFNEILPPLECVKAGRCIPPVSDGVRHGIFAL